MRSLQRKKTITESQLRGIIAESIKQCLSEVGYGYHGQIEGYNGDPKGSEEWKRERQWKETEPHDDAWHRRYTQHLKDKGVIFEGDYDDIFRELYTC